MNRQVVAALPAASATSARNRLLQHHGVHAERVFRADAGHHFPPPALARREILDANKP